MLYNLSKEKGTSKMQVNDEIVNQMLRNLPAAHREQMASILKGQVAFEVVDPSEDKFEDVEVPVLDEDKNPVLYKSGQHKGEAKTTTEKKLVQEGGNGRVVAHIMTDGSVVPLVDEKGRMWLRSSRMRTDGEWGFQSWSGLDTLIAAHESGIINEAQPTKDDLYKMASRLNANPPKYATIKGERNVDGFIIREVRK
jgi:hypothetical protein